MRDLRVNHIRPSKNFELQLRNGYENFKFIKKLNEKEIIEIKQRNVKLLNFIKKKFSLKNSKYSFKIFLKKFFHKFEKKN